MMSGTVLKDLTAYGVLRFFFGEAPIAAPQNCLPYRGKLDSSLTCVYLGAVLVCEPEHNGPYWLSLR